MTDPTEFHSTAARVRPASRFAGRTALVTGGGSGIGRAAALALTSDGATVAVAGRRRSALDETVDAIEAAGGSAAAFPTDLSDPDAPKRLVDAVVARFGRLDLAFNNAGATHPIRPSGELSVSEFDDVFGVNVRAVWLLIVHELAAMREHGTGGAIVNTSSIAATGGVAGLSIYSASKAAVDALARVAAVEAGPDGIRINNVSPGVIRTPMTADFLEQVDAAEAMLAGHAALKRVGEPDDVGDVVAWLCSDDARFVTGQSILVDGGFNLPGAR